LFDITSESWVELPDDPLTATYDRHVVACDADLCLFAKPIDSAGAELPSMLGARFERQSRTWTMLPTAGSIGFQAGPSML